MALPDPLDVARTRLVLGDFVLDPPTPVKEVCDFYDIPIPRGSDVGVESWILSTLERTPIVGDEVPLGPGTLVIRGACGGEITLVGLKLHKP